MTAQPAAYPGPRGFLIHDRRKSNREAARKDRKTSEPGYPEWSRTRNSVRLWNKHHHIQNNWPLLLEYHSTLGRILHISFPILSTMSSDIKLCELVYRLSSTSTLHITGLPSRTVSLVAAVCLKRLPNRVFGAILNPRSYSAINMQHFTGIWAHSLTAGELGSVPPYCSAARAWESPSCNVNTQSENDADWLNYALPGVVHMLQFTDANKNIMGRQ